MVISITRLTFFYLFYLFIFFALNVYHRSQTHSSCEHLRTTNENVCLKLMVYASSYLFPVFFSPFIFFLFTIIRFFLRIGSNAAYITHTHSQLLLLLLLLTTAARDLALFPKNLTSKTQQK